MDSSAKHGRRVDEQLDRDVAALVHGAADEGRQEWRRLEAPGDGEPEVVAAPRSDEEAILELRASIARAVVPSTFPATAGALSDIAAGAHAPPPVLDSLRALPEGRVYQTVGELCQDLGIDDVASGTGHVSSGDDGRATSDE